MAAERGQASSLVNAGFRAPRVEEKEKTRVKGREGGRGGGDQRDRRPRLIERKRTNKRSTKRTRSAGERAKLLDGEIHRDNLIPGLRCG